MKYNWHCLRCAWAALLRRDWATMRFRFRWTIGWVKEGALA